MGGVSTGACVSEHVRALVGACTGTSVCSWVGSRWAGKRWACRCVLGVRGDAGGGTCLRGVGGRRKDGLRGGRVKRWGARRWWCGGVVVARVRTRGGRVAGVVACVDSCHDACAIFFKTPSRPTQPHPTLCTCHPQRAAAADTTAAAPCRFLKRPATHKTHSSVTKWRGERCLSFECAGEGGGYGRGSVRISYGVDTNTRGMIRGDRAGIWHAICVFQAFDVKVL